MQYILVVSEGKLGELNHHVLQNDDEQIMVMFCGVSRGAGQVRLICKDLIKARPRDLESCSEFGATLKKRFLRRILRRAKRDRLSVIICHSHPFSGEDVCFSVVDDANDAEMASYVSSRIPGILFGSLVVGRTDIKARIYDKAERKMVRVDEVWVIGRTIMKYPEKSVECDYQPFLRQVLLFGWRGQDKLVGFTVAVVGLGGLGIIVAEMLCRLGIGRLIVVDFDLVEVSNLNRLLGATADDVGRAKVEVFKAGAAKYSRTRIDAICGSILALSVLERVKEAEVVFGCVDNETARSRLNDWAVKYCIPLIDLATGIVGERGFIEAGGQVRVVLPDGFCLNCIGGIDSNQVMQELLTEEDIQMRNAAGYIRDFPIPSPSVISLNGVIASFGVTEFLNLALGIRKANLYVAYDMMSNQILSQTIKAKRNRNCLTCHEKGMRAMGDLIPFPDLFDDKTSENVPDITKEG